MKTIKGPGIFLAQFAGDTAPFNTLEGMANWAADTGVCRGADSELGQPPVRFEALPRRARTTATKCWASCSRRDLQLTELSTHLQGQLVASHPAYRRVA